MKFVYRKLYIYTVIFRKILNLFKLLNLKKNIMENELI